MRSAVLYVLRLLLDEPLPLNEGFLANVELHVPPFGPYQADVPFDQIGRSWA